MPHGPLVRNDDKRLSRRFELEGSQGEPPPFDGRRQLLVDDDGLLAIRAEDHNRNIVGAVLAGRPGESDFIATCRGKVRQERKGLFPFDFVLVVDVTVADVAFAELRVLPDADPLGLAVVDNDSGDVLERQNGGAGVTRSSGVIQFHDFLLEAVEPGLQGFGFGLKRRVMAIGLARWGSGTVFQAETFEWSSSCEFRKIPANA